MDGFDEDRTIEYYVKKFLREFRRDVERENLHQQYYRDDDESDEAVEWQMERNIIAKLICDDIMGEMREKKMSLKVKLKVWIQIEKETKEIFENYKKELGIDEVKNESEIAESARKIQACVRKYFARKLCERKKAARYSAAMKVTKLIRNCFVKKVREKSAKRIQTKLRMLFAKRIVNERYTMVLRIQASIRRYLTEKIY